MAVATAAVISIISAAFSGYQAYKSKKEMEKANASDGTDLKSSVKQDATPLRRVYGQSLGGGVVSYVEEQESDEENQKLTTCIVTASHEIDSLSAIYIGDSVAWVSDENPLNRSIDHTTLSLENKGFNTYASPLITRFNSTTIRFTSGAAVSNTLSLGYSTELLVWDNNPAINDYVSYPITSYNKHNRTITSSKTLPTNLTKVIVGQRLIDVEQANNPKTITDVPNNLRSTKYWNDTMIGKGLHYVGLKLTFDQTVFSSGFPQFMFERKGAKLYDPRIPEHIYGDRSTYTYSNNAALVIFDVLTQVYDYRITELDVEQFIVAANDCDTVTIRGDKRYTINGEFEVSDPLADTLNEMLQACAGSITMVEGKLGINVGVYQGVPANTINENHIVGDVAIAAEAPFQEALNTVNVLYSDSINHFEKGEANPASTLDLSQVGENEIVSEDIDVSKWCTSANQAQRLAWIRLRKSVDIFDIQTQVNLEGYAAAASGHTDFVLPEAVIDGEFAVKEWTYSNDNGINLYLTKEDPSYYDDDFAYVEPEKTARPPISGVMPAIKNLTFNLNADNVSQGVLTWDEVISYQYGIEIFKTSDDSLVANYITNLPILQLNNLDRVEHRAEVYVVSKLGRQGIEVDLLFTPERPPAQVYTWVAYADDGQGAGITLDPSNKNFMGTAVNRSAKTPDISNPSVYAWIKVKGEDGASGASGASGDLWETWYVESGGLPSTPSASYPPIGGWSITPPSNPSLPIWSTALRVNKETLTYHYPYSYPLKITGANGSRGSINITDPTTGTSWSNLEAYSALTAATASNGYAQQWDTVNLFNTTDEYSEHKSYVSGSGSSSVWAAIGLYVDGNQIVNGAIKANHLTTDSIQSGHISSDAISGNEISATAQITVGTSNNSVTLNGDHSSHLMWGGNIDATDAPFAVSNTGQLTATGAVIKSASSGSRLVLNNDRLEVWEGTTLRVVLGRL